MFGSFLRNIAGQVGQQTGSALGGGANPLQNGGGGGFLGGVAPQIAQAIQQQQQPQQNTMQLGGSLGGMPAPMQNPFMGIGPYQPISSVNSTTTQDMLGGGSGGQFGQALGQLGMGGPGTVFSPQQLQQQLFGQPPQPLVQPQAEELMQSVYVSPRLQQIRQQQQQMQQQQQAIKDRMVQEQRLKMAANPTRTFSGGISNLLRRVGR